MHCRKETWRVRGKRGSIGQLSIAYSKAFEFPKTEMISLDN